MWARLNQSGRDGIKEVSIAFFVSRTPETMALFNQKTGLTVLLMIGSLLVAAAYVEHGDTASSAEREALLVIKPMRTARAAHTATLLYDGTVLIAGGFARDRESEPFASAERYDPERGAFIATGAMTTGRQSHSATLLTDGRVLIVGGYDGSYLASAELYDPSTGAFAATGNMTVGRIGHRAARLNDGRVLISGGTTAGRKLLASAELYDPATGQFTPTGTMTIARISHTQTVLTDGTVLITGGTAGRRTALKVSARAELFDPAVGAFRPVGTMILARHKHAAVLMEDERVLVVGGSDETDGRGRYDSAEIYDPATGTFMETGRLNKARFKLRTAVTLLTDGTVLVAGGADVLEVYDPEAERFTALQDQFDAARFFSTATLLEDGRVLIAGGYDRRIQSTAKSWIYEP